MLDTRFKVLVDFNQVYVFVSKILNENSFVGVRLVKNDRVLKKITKNIFIHYYAAILSRNVYYQTVNDSNAEVGALAPKT